MQEIHKFIQKIGNSLIIDENFLREQYIDNLLSYQEICNLLDNKISVEGVRRNLIRYNIIRNSDQQKLAKQLATDKSREVVRQKYGVDNISQLESVKEKKRDSCLEHNGVSCGLLTERCLKKTRAPKSEEWKDKVRKYDNELDRAAAKQLAQKRHASKRKQERVVRRINLYGSLGHDAPGYLQKEIDTCMEKYGVPFPCMRKECRNYSSNNSLPNRSFKELLINHSLYSDEEFTLQGYSFDFRSNNTLVEINPTATHNLDWTPFGSHKGIEQDYHSKKSAIARTAGYNCIHVFDWDDQAKIISLLKSGKLIHARKCDIRVVTSDDAREFLSNYHLQSYTRSQPIRLGLYYRDELVQLMTFGKPRYNKTCEWELLRLCTKSDIRVVGGASRLFKHFIKTYAPKSIISYCDLSKFSGHIYETLGFTLDHINAPSIHWFNPVKKVHITDNLLRQRGFDQLFGTSYGKGTSNYELMRNAGFSRVADCGQSTYIWNLRMQ